jgi:hypothetical protein
MISEVAAMGELPCRDLTVSRSFVIIAFFSDILIKFMSSYKNVCRCAFFGLLALGSLVFSLSCGNNNNIYGVATPSATSGFKHRIMVTNAFAGTNVLVNADNDVVYGRPISTLPGNDILAESHDGTFDLSYSNGPNELYYIDNTIEDVSGTPVTLTGSAESLGIMANNTTAVTASYNAPVNGEPDGAVLVIDLTNRVISSTISVPSARRIAIDHKGSKVLAFADNSNTAYVVDTTAFTATPIADPNGVLDHPVTAIFSTDDSKAYILSCGSECGGTQAKVTVFNPSDNSLGNSVVVTGATAGIIDSSGKLYVAGSAGGAGTLQTIDTGALASGSATPSAPVAIQDGYHRVMAFTDDSRLYIGSSNCTNVKSGTNDVQGCLATYNTSSQAVVKTAPTGDVTGILPIIGRHLAYVVQGGDLVIYDTTMDAPRPSGQIDVVGQAYAILQIS